MSLHPYGIRHRERVEADQRPEEQQPDRDEVGVDDRVQPLVLGRPAVQRREVERGHRPAEQHPRRDRVRQHRDRREVEHPEHPPLRRTADGLQGQGQWRAQHDQERRHHPEQQVLVTCTVNDASSWLASGGSSAIAITARPARNGIVRPTGHRRVRALRNGERRGRRPQRSGRRAAPASTVMSEPSCGGAPAVQRQRGVGSAVASEARRPPMLTIGAVVWLASEVMFFSGLFAGYFALGPSGQWPPAGVELDVAAATIFTVVLVLSSGTMHWAVRAVQRDDRPSGAAVAGRHVRARRGLHRQPGAEYGEPAGLRHRHPRLRLDPSTSRPGSTVSTCSAGWPPCSLMAGSRRRRPSAGATRHGRGRVVLLALRRRGLDRPVRTIFLLR